jgi:hypothetical protein
MGYVVLATRSGWSTGPGEGHDEAGGRIDRLEVPEDRMFGRQQGPRDPFEGTAARRTHLRLRVEGIMALALAIAACGLTAALWLRTLAPFADRFGLG